MKRGTIEHPKMKRLARELGIEHLLAVGIMEALWHWTARYAPAGDIGKHSDADIADGIGYRGDMSRLVQTLADVGFIDRCERHRLIIHDWPDHADDAVKKWAARNKITLISKAVTTRVETCPDNGGTCPEKICLPEPLPEPLPERGAKPDMIPRSLDTEKFRFAWKEFLEHLRHKTGQAMSAQWIEVNLMECCRRGVDKAVRDIRFSIEKNAKTLLDGSVRYDGKDGNGDGKPKMSITERKAYEMKMATEARAKQAEAGNAT